MDQINSITTLVFTILVFILLIGIGYPFFVKDNTPQEEVAPFCGTESPVKTTLGKQGKELFKVQCAACHNKNMRSKSTGPALGKVFRRFNSDTLMFMAYLQDQKTFLKTTKDKRFKQLRKEYGQSYFHHHPKLTKEEVTAIIAYTQAIYSH